MTAKEILEQLESLGSETTKKTLIKHGAREPFFGVRISDMKPIQKQIKKNYELALELYDTGISDAMYLAGLIADEKKMTKQDLEKWVQNAYWSMLSDYTVAWVAAESRYGMELALEWIESDIEVIESAGWATLSHLMAYLPNNQLDIKRVSELLDYVGRNIHLASNMARYSMNNFIISAGSYVPAVREQALRIASEIGTVIVDMGNTSCKVPDARNYIFKTIERNPEPKKKKTVRC